MTLTLPLTDELQPDSSANNPVTIPTADDWTFNSAYTRDLTHCYHDYPARMIPPIARRLIDLFGADARTLFDPYCGTGTSLVEGRVRGLNVIGTDLNPLARLITSAKTTIVDAEKLNKHFEKWVLHINQNSSNALHSAPAIRGIERLEFWFKPEVIQKLSLIREFIETIYSEPTRRFFQIAFSETVRECSNTRNNEFKLYRYASETLEDFNPDVYGVFWKKLKRNQAGLQAFINCMKKLGFVPSVQVHSFNTVESIPSKLMQVESVDLVVTSPPYGDSHTTVAYGQYSRLSSAWLDLEEPAKVDRRLMGGKSSKAIHRMVSDELNDAIKSVHNIDEKRAHEVTAFYVDLEASIRNVATVVRSGGYACYVVGNRKVKGIVLPTDDAVRRCFEVCNFDYVDTFIRSIPNKRMPLKNSPSNASGSVDVTMTNEYIVVMQKQ